MFNVRSISKGENAQSCDLKNLFGLKLGHICMVDMHGLLKVFSCYLVLFILIEEVSNWGWGEGVAGI